MIKTKTKTKTKTKPKTDKSIGEEIAERLQAFNKAIAAGKPVSERFACNRVILNLHPREYTPAMVKKARKSLNLSQALFAQFIGASPGSVKAWEQGINPVPGLARRLMDEIIGQREYWLQRLEESIVDKIMDAEATKSRKRSPSN